MDKYLIFFSPEIIEHSDFGFEHDKASFTKLAVAKCVAGLVSSLVCLID